MTSRTRYVILFITFAVMTLLQMAVGCSATPDSSGFGGQGQGGDTGPIGPSTGPGSFASVTGPGSGGGHQGDPKTCDEAAMYKTYLGCDFWPTVVANQVWSVFDYAVVVANAGAMQADVKVERNGMTVGMASIAPDSLGTIYLPWVTDLKGPDFDNCTSVVPFNNSVRSNGGAYHLTSTVPVTVYQFSALEYAPMGGPAGKNWGACPAPQCPLGIPCFSFSNDASLLLPTTALTGNYRVTGMQGWVNQGTPILGDYFAITGTANNTNVQVFISGTGTVLGGGGISGSGPNSKFNLMLNAGDVVEVVGDPNSDLSGSLVKADQPVQVISGIPCTYLPADQAACDHMEESVMPAETLGKHYFVAPPSSPHNTVYGQVVRIYGNVDGTTLSYPSGMPPGAPTSINAGQMVDLGIVMSAFEIQGDHEFAVGQFTLAAALVDANDPISMQEGDPAQTQAVAVEQYRIKYVFLAPNDYTENYVQVIQPMGANILLDGQPTGVTPVAIGSGYGVARITLSQGANNGAHVITGDQAFGIQVIGYGLYTSYHYPGGLNLDQIAPPPPPPK